MNSGPGSLTIHARMKAWTIPAAAWAGLGALHAALSAAVPRSALRDPLLPLWAKAALLATELVLLGALVALLAWPLARVHRVLRGIAVAGVLGWLGTSWTLFAWSGQFLDDRGLAFLALDPGAQFAYARDMHALELVGLPGLVLLAAWVSCEVLPRRVEGFRRPAIAAAGLLALSAAGVAAAELAHRGAEEGITESETGVTHTTRDLYRVRRERCAGPLTSLVARLFPDRDGLGEAAELPVLRRPIEPLEAWTARVDPSRAKSWNVVLVLVDSLRADHLGGPRRVLPALEELAKGGRVFTDCLSQASHTDYAVPPVFSSHYPLRAREPRRHPDVPAWPRVLIHDLLKALGRRTAIYSSQNEEWGRMDRYLRTPGLDRYVHAKTRGGSAAVAQVDDAVTVSDALDWIGSGEPFFLALNLHNAHVPYAVPEGFKRPFGPDRIDFRLTAGGYPAERAGVVRDLYADSLAYVDGQLARLFGALKERGLWERTLIVVTADHGEAFLEHGSAAHANGVYDEVMRVPLVVRAPGLEPGRESRPAQLVDVAPTLLGLLGLPPHPSFQGLDLLAAEFPRERSRWLLCDSPWNTHLALVRSGHKLIHDGRLGRCVLYDLGADPGEKRDVLAERPELARELRGRLAAFRRGQVGYYGDVLRQGREYPPILVEELR